MKPMLMAGNWKMHKLTAEARKLTADLKAFLPDIDQPVRVLLCPPFTALAEVAKIVEGSAISLGAQHMHWAKRGAYTGEISADMLKDLGCEYVIIGHSERRHIFGETDADVNKKVKAALEAGLKPIVCVGETEKERESGKTEEVVSRQVNKGLDKLLAKQMGDVVIAYEPVWAIGTGKNATPAQAQKVHTLIRKLVLDKFNQSVASSLLILYGGSVNPGNAVKLMSQRDINGALVGGASLDAYAFETIVRAGVEAS